MFQVLSHSHRLHDLLHEYPIDLVLNLYRAQMDNRRGELKAKVLGLTVAVINAIGTTIGGGKGEVLNAWFKALDGHPDGQAEAPERQASIPPGTRKFFAGAPIVKKPKG